MVLEALSPAERTAFLLGVRRKGASVHHPVDIDGAPGIVLTHGGALVGTAALTVTDRVISGIDMVVNPAEPARARALFEEKKEIP